MEGADRKELADKRQVGKVSADCRGITCSDPIMRSTPKFWQAVGHFWCNSLIVLEAIWWGKQPLWALWGFGGALKRFFFVTSILVSNFCMPHISAVKGIFFSREKSWVFFEKYNSSLKNKSHSLQGWHVMWMWSGCAKKKNQRKNNTFLLQFEHTCLLTSTQYEKPQVMWQSSSSFEIRVDDCWPY